MKKFLFITALLLIMYMLFLVKITEAATIDVNEFLSWPGYSQEMFDQQCPYGDAVVVKKDENAAFDKNRMLHDCVFHRPGENTWITKDYDFYTKSFVLRHIDPKEYNVYTIEGELLLDNDRVIIKEE